MQRSLRAFGALSRNPTILWRLTEREVASRYRGSLLGWGWTLLNPLLMLAVYTFVFSTVFKACLLYTSPSPRDKRQSRMPSSA